jgi:hypothetical protein
MPRLALGSARKPRAWDGSGVYRTVAGTAVEVAAVFELDSPKTFGNAFNADILVATVVSLTVSLRKINTAHLAALWALVEANANYRQFAKRFRPRQQVFACEHSFAIHRRTRSLDGQRTAAPNGSFAAVFVYH